MVINGTTRIGKRFALSEMLNATITQYTQRYR